MTAEPPPPGPAPAMPTPTAGAGAGGPWWRQRNAILALAGLVIVIVVIVVATSGGSNGWTPALQAQTLRACEDQANLSAQGCECAVKWMVAHVSPSQAATGGEALGKALAGQVLTACPSLVGGG